MVTLHNVSVEDPHQILAEVNDADATKRPMAAIAYKDIDDLIQAEAAVFCRFSNIWALKCFNRLERLADVSFGQVIYDKPRSGKPTEIRYTAGSMSSVIVIESLP